ncbi:ferritin-like domain-containing protein [Pseudanabaena sp. FACHB-2040]|nr:ferritin-like domain-containing protein [Pseudanabaena sp. FACHB-2040]
MLFLVLFLLSSLTMAPAASAQNLGPVLSPQQVVEFALTLEKLEADLYRRSLQATQSGSLTNTPRLVRSVFASYGEDEAQHVMDLSTVLTSLGGDPDAITIPDSPNYNAILGRDPFANLADLLLALQRVEDLGVAAYKGQVPNLQAAGSTVILAGALEIHTVEARHAAGIRYLRQVLQNANIRPWIRDAGEVIYPEVRADFVIPFEDEAFDGFATSDEVLALVGPVLMPAAAQQVSRERPSPAVLEGSITQSDCPAQTNLVFLSGGYICNP